jgi:hypothetical protein
MESKKLKFVNSLIVVDLIYHYLLSLTGLCRATFQLIKGMNKNSLFTKATLAHENKYVEKWSSIFYTVLRCERNRPAYKPEEYEARRNQSTSSSTPTSDSTSSTPTNEQGEGASSLTPEQNTMTPPNGGRKRRKEDKVKERDATTVKQRLIVEGMKNNRL